MEFEITTDILPSLTWTFENSEKQGLQKTTIYYFALTTCAYCKKGLVWLREKHVAIHWMYLDQLPMEQKNAIKDWIKKKYKLTTEIGMPFVIFRVGNQDFISNGYDPEYWNAKVR